MNGDNILFVVLAIFALIGVLLVVSPAGFIECFKSARPDLKDNPDFTDMDENPAAKSFVKFLGILFICVTVVIFLAFALAH